MLTAITITLGLALVTLIQHHRRATQRHNRSVEAWCTAIQLLASGRVKKAPRIPALKPKKRAPAPRAPARRRPL